MTVTVPPEQASAASTLLRRHVLSTVEHLTRTADLLQDAADVLRRGLADDAQPADVALGLLVLGTARHDLTGPQAEDNAVTVAAGLLRAWPTAEAWQDICEAVDEREDMLTLPAAVAVEKWCGLPVGPDPQRRADERVERCDELLERYARKAVS